MKRTRQNSHKTSRFSFNLSIFSRLVRVDSLASQSSWFGVFLFWLSRLSISVRRRVRLLIFFFFLSFYLSACYHASFHAFRRRVLNILLLLLHRSVRFMDCTSSNCYWCNARNVRHRVASYFIFTTLTLVATCHFCTTADLLRSTERHRWWKLFNARLFSSSLVFFPFKCVVDFLLKTFCDKRPKCERGQSWSCPSRVNPAAGMFWHQNCRLLKKSEG